MTINNVISISGGKDSTATLLLAIATETPNISAVFADTGNEHELTYDYVRYLEDAVGIPIRWVKADFTEQLARKREYIKTHWPAEGVPMRIVDRALAVLRQTGNPYLDMCLWKGRFPSRKAQFCTAELKVNPIFEQVFFPMLDEGNQIWSWQGVRADESLNRRYLPTFEEVGGGLWNYRPIIKWPASATFDAMRYMGIKPNPLYTQGCGRVGCMPCINCNKPELRNIADRWPEHIDRIAEWEWLVSMASKIGASTFFAGSNAKHTSGSIASLSPEEIFKIANVRSTVEWSKTTRGGRQYDLIAVTSDSSQCLSSYGLCEAEEAA